MAVRQPAAGHQLLMIEEVAELLRRPESTLRWWRHVGHGPRSFKIGRRVVYDRADVEAFLQQCRAAETERAA